MYVHICMYDEYKYGCDSDNNSDYGKNNSNNSNQIFDNKNDNNDKSYD